MILTLLLACASLLSCASPGPERRQAPVGDGGATSADGGAADGGAADGGAADGGVETGGGELRGVWLTRYEWASTSTTASSVEETMAAIAGAGFNAVFFQVRANFDAYYPSELEPWASRLTGTLGQDPGWDPLQVAVDAARKNGLQLHAYINVAPFWMGSAAPSSVGVTHAWTEHSDWGVVDSSGTAQTLNDGYVYASLGNAQVQARTAAVAADIARRYAIDGIHLDYIRYPASNTSHDTASLARHALDSASGGAWPGLSYGDWQREMVKETARQVRDAVDVPVTAAVWGIHTDEWGWSGVSEGNGDYYQDSRAFLSEGLVDATLPMAYWAVTETEGERLDFRVLTRDHLAHASGRHVYMGIGTYELGYEETVRCIEAARAEGAHGVVVFSWTYISAYADQLKAGVFSTPADPPAMTWRR